MRLPHGAVVLLPEAAMSEWRPVSLRFDASGPELRCRHCQEWWPLTPEYWMRRTAGHVRIDMCRSCNNERGRLYQALRRHDPEFVESEKQRHKRSYRRYRQWIRRNHPDLLDAYNRERREADRVAHTERRAA